MTERHDLERSLRALSAAIEYPPGDGLSERVGRELRAGASGTVSRRVTWPRRRIIVVAVASLLVIAASAGAARLVIGAIEIKVVPSAAPSALPETGPNLGKPMSIVEAGHASGFSIPVPSSLGQPGGVFVDQGRVSLCWKASPTLSEDSGHSVGCHSRGAPSGGGCERQRGAAGDLDPTGSRR